MTFAELEKTRLALKNKVTRIRRICLLILAPFFLLFAFAVVPRDFRLVLMLVTFLLIFGFVVSAIIIAIFTRKESAAYHDAYKNYFVLKSLEQTFSNLRYDSHSGLSRATLSSTGMVNTGDRFHSGDYVSGKYKDIGFEQSDVHIEEEHTTTDSDGDTTTTYVTIFRGRWLIFDFHKRFNSKVQIVQKHFAAALRPPKSSRIETESTEFNKKFRVFTGDGFEMFYLLTPDFIINIESLAASIRGSLMLCFVDNKLHIAVSDGTDSFEPSSYKHPIDEQAELAKVSADIKTITNFVDSLKLRA